MPIEFFPFSQWTPSIEHGQRGALLRNENLIPSRGGYRSLPRPTNNGGSPTAPAGETFNAFLPGPYVHLYPEVVGVQLLPDNPTEFYSARQTVAPGTEAISIYTYQNGAWAHLTTYTGVDSLTGIFRFASYGNDIWAVSPIAQPQRRTANAGAFANGVVSVTVPTSPRFIGVVRGFMIITNYLDQFWWSNTGDPTNYDTTGGSVAGTGFVKSQPGGIMGFCGGEYGIFWKRNSMHAIQHTGGEDIFRLDDISVGVGTPAPSSIIVCRDGYRRFWGGDGFYEQAGLAPPERISPDELTDVLLHNGTYVGDRGLNYEDVYSRLWHEDSLMVGWEEPEANGCFWIYQAGTADWANVQAVASMTKGVYLDYGRKTWTMINFPEGLFGATPRRSFTNTVRTPFRTLVGAFAPSGGGAHQRCTFTSTTHCAWTVATARLALGREGLGSVQQRAKIKAIAPVLTLNQSTLANDYRLATVPSTLAVRLVWSSEPHFNAKTDADGTQVSPGNEQRTMADADEFGWIHFNREGRDFLLEMTLAESTTAVRGVPGCWVDWEPVG